MNKEIVNAIKSTNTVEELKGLAAKNGYNLTDEEANGYFDMYHTNGKIADKELDNVAGGGCGDWCRGASRYSSDKPHMLIVTAGNYCAGYLIHPQPDQRWGLKYTCWSCAHKQKDGPVVTYCTIRTFDNDPYNKK